MNKKEVKQVLPHYNFLGKTRKGQVTIFVIGGILLIAVVGIFFLMKADIIPTPGGENPDEDPVGYLETCIEAKVLEGTELIMKNGGYRDLDSKLKINFKFEEEDDFSDIVYLCYNHDNSYPCINQEPMLIQHLKTELKEHIKLKVDECWDELMGSLTSKDNVVKGTSQTFEIRLAPNKVIIGVDGELTLIKKGISSVQKYFEVIIPSKFYDLAIVSQEIVSQEATYCSFQTLGYQMLHPEFKIDMFQTGDSQKIYTITDKKTKEWIRFAIKGCTIPPAY